MNPRHSSALSLPQCPLHQARSAVKQRPSECYFVSYAHLRRVFVVKTTCRKPRLSEYGLRARLTSVGDGVPQGVEYRSPVGAAPLQDRGLGLLRDAPTHHRRQYQAHCLRVPGIPRSLRARGKASLCRRHRPYRGPAGRQEIGRLSSIPSHAEPLHIFERRAPQIPEKQVMRRGGALVPAHSRHHQRLRGVGFKWN